MTQFSLLAIPLTAGLLLGAVPPPAPIPPQIAAAHKIFISNAGDDCFFAGCARNFFYNEFYAAMKSWGRYQMTDNPAEADLIFELSLSATSVPQTEELVREKNSYSRLDPRYKLAIVDPKTHVTLWAFIEHPQWAFLEQNQAKNHALARTQIVADLKQLVNSSALGSGS